MVVCLRNGLVPVPHSLHPKPALAPLIPDTEPRKNHPEPGAAQGGRHVYRLTGAGGWASC